MAKSELEKKILSEVMSNLAKQSHKKSPRPKEFYQNMAKKSAESKKRNKEV